MGLKKEFKEFALRGNVMDLAIGVIIGGAFGKIVNSVVNDIIMPPIGVLIGGVSFSDLKMEIASAVIENGKEITPPVYIHYGSFIQVVFEFIIIAFAIFMMIRMMNKFSTKGKQEVVEESPTPTPFSNQEILLQEIRDLLKNKQS